MVCWIILASRVSERMNGVVNLIFWLPRSSSPSLYSTFVSLLGTLFNPRSLFPFVANTIVHISSHVVFATPTWFFPLVMQKYSKQGVLCRCIQIRVFCAEILVRYHYAIASHVWLTIWIRPNQTQYDMNAMFILFPVPLITQMGQNQRIVGLETSFFFHHARKYFFRTRAEILPCDLPSRQHSYAEPFLGLAQTYFFLGEIFTSGQTRERLNSLFY